ncbi:uncharacterized protein LOC121738028 [Aricia agestis]|uniref:uncharacterized protein LOC121738028 n=1 Tax=Aricia agestis TaxID=91739 RepID=UPI001C206B07|nr:uncharacterized protein LOC121738028 [Aricia agestis]
MISITFQKVDITRHFNLEIKETTDIKIFGEMVNLLQWVLITLNIIVVTGNEGVKKIDLTIDEVGESFANGTKLNNGKENERPTNRKLFSWLGSLMSNMGDKISEKVDKIIKKQEKTVKEILENINNLEYDHIEVVGSPGIISIQSSDPHNRNFRIFTNITGKLNGNIYINGVKWGRDENNQWTTEKNGNTPDEASDIEQDKEYDSTTSSANATDTNDEYNAEFEIIHPETQYNVSVEYTQNNTNIQKNYTDIRIYPFDTWRLRKQVNNSQTGKIISDTVENVNVNDLIEIVESPGMITVKSRAPHEIFFKTFTNVKGNYEYINIHGVKWARGENNQWTTARSDAVETKNAADEASDIEQEKEYESTTLSANITDTSDGKDDFEQVIDGETEEERIERFKKKLFPDGHPRSKVITYTYYTGQ